MTDDRQNQPPHPLAKEAGGDQVKGASDQLWGGKIRIIEEVGRGAMGRIGRRELERAGRARSALAFDFQQSW